MLNSNIKGFLDCNGLSKDIFIGGLATFEASSKNLHVDFNYVSSREPLGLFKRLYSLLIYILPVSNSAKKHS